MGDPRDRTEYLDQGVPEPRGGIGHNQPPAPTDVFGPRIGRLLADLTALIAQPTTERNAQRLRDVVKRAADLTKEMNEAKAKDKQPHFDANTAIEASYSPLVDDADRIKKQARSRIDAFLIAEEERRVREANEARRKADEAAAAAEKAKAEAATAPDPVAAVEADDAAYDATMAEHEAVHAERRADAGPRVGSAAGLGRATSLRSYWSVKVVDPDALVAHFAKDRDVLAAATKAANAFARATKGSQPIPGCDILEDRRSA